jgi:hypothetical protein
MEAVYSNSIFVRALPARVSQVQVAMSGEDIVMRDAVVSGPSDVQISMSKRSRTTKGLKDLMMWRWLRGSGWYKLDRIVRLDKGKDISGWQRLSQRICTLARERGGESNSGYW